MFLSCSLLLPLLLPAAAQSRVVQVDGSTLSGKLVAATLEQVTLKNADGKSRELAAGDVLQIYPAPLTEMLLKGEAFLKDLDYQNASSAFEAAGNESGDFWVAPYALLRQAETLLAWAQMDRARASDAARAFRSWMDANTDSFWIPRAEMGAAKAMAMAGDVDGATSLMQKLADTAFEKNLGKHVELQVNLVRCEAFLIGGQAEVAEARLRDLVVKLGNAVQDPKAPEGTRSLILNLYSQSQILLGDAIHSKDGPQAAAPYWQGLAKDRTATPNVRAAAWIGIAEAARAAGHPRQAQLHLAKVVATLPASEEVMAHALYLLGEVSTELGDTPTAGDLYRRRLLDRYPSTSWAAKAR